MSRPTTLRVAAVAAVSLSLCLASADAGVTMKQNATQTVIYKYSLANGTSSDFIAVPQNTVILLTANQTTVGDIGVASLALHNIPGDALQWVGGSSHDGAVSNFSDVAGTVIVRIDLDGAVELVTAVSGGQFGFIISNVANTAVTLTGEVRLYE